MINTTMIITVQLHLSIYIRNKHDVYLFFWNINVHKQLVINK